MQNNLKDIEDLTKTCPKTGSSCAGLCHKSKELKIAFDNEKHWHKVTTIEAIFNILEKCGDIPYMLVAGNTAHGQKLNKRRRYLRKNYGFVAGVYRRNENIKLFIDITGVELLRSHTIGAELTLGGNVSLTEAMDIFTNVSIEPGFEYCKYLVDHIDLIANVPVRNVSCSVSMYTYEGMKLQNFYSQSGTIAGNLSIKHGNIEFPSDMFLILEAVGAMLTIASGLSETTMVSVADYVYMNMDKKIILNIILPSLDRTLYTYRSYKVQKPLHLKYSLIQKSF